MTHIEILAAYETEIGVINKALEKPSTDDSMFWLNQGVNKFVKLRFNGDLVHRTGYEQTEKRRNDLSNLFTFKVYNTPSKNSTHDNYDSYVVDYPSDFMYVLDEDVIISDNNNQHRMDTCVFECTRDSYMYRINNSLTDFHYRFHRARPLRIRTAKGCEILTDKNYKILLYKLGYLRKPNEITLDDPEKVYDEYTDFDESTIYEIIKIAAQMYLENVESKRYESISQEVLTQE